MRTKFITNALFVLPFVILMTCSNENIHTDVIEESTLFKKADSKDFVKAPTLSGPYVYRTEDFVPAWIISDPKTELTAVVGWDYETQLNWCTGDYDFDWLIENSDFVPTQIIDNPSTESRLLVLNQGQVRVLVLDGYFDYSYAFCDFVNSAEFIAEGQAHYNATDNDLLAFLSNSNNTNTWRARANGNVFNLDQEQMRLNVFWQWLWDKNEPANDIDDLLIKTSVQLH